MFGGNLKRLGPRSDADRVCDELLVLAGSWRRILADDPMHARPIVSSLLKGRVHDNAVLSGADAMDVVT
jgi:hypothetical protein